MKQLPLPKRTRFFPSDLLMSTRDLLMGKSGVPPFWLGHLLPCWLWRLIEFDSLSSNPRACPCLYFQDVSWLSILSPWLPLSFMLSLSSYLVILLLLLNFYHQFSTKKPVIFLTHKEYHAISRFRILQWLLIYLHLKTRLLPLVHHYTLISFIF